MPRVNPPGHTTASGQGAQHMAARQRALRYLLTQPAGILCARCEANGRDHVITPDMVQKGARGLLVSKWLDLDDFPGRRFGGPQTKRLSGRNCNRAQGAMVTNAAKAAKKRAEYTRW